MQQFLNDVVRGLSASRKFLESKYFYDAQGDELFRDIMNCPEYYLTDCEMEIFTQQTQELAVCLANGFDTFDVVELGAGDATKSIHLLKQLVNNKVSFNYYPVDISGDVINLLHQELPKTLPGLQMHGLNGEYFNMLEKATNISDKPKAVLFLGSNIGNITLEDSLAFCKRMRSLLTRGDFVLIGFDLQKDPQVILDAYNDKGGYTRQFNLNLLHRINRELSGNFDVSQFKHYPTYDPGTGACKSYLVSMADQQVEVADRSFTFTRYEPIFMEVSQKYSLKQIDELATAAGFKPVRQFFDAKKWFVDTVWECI